MDVGALLKEVPKDGEPMNIMGSALVAWASSKEEVMEMLKKDTYVKEGVWDLSKVSGAVPDVRVAVLMCSRCRFIRLKVLFTSPEGRRESLAGLYAVGMSRMSRASKLIVSH